MRYYERKHPDPDCLYRCEFCGRWKIGELMNVHYTRSGLVLELICKRCDGQDVRGNKPCW